MKKLTQIFSIGLFFFFIFSVTTTAQYSSVMDKDPLAVQSAVDTIPPGSFPLTQKWVFDYSAIPEVNGGTVGAIFFEGKFYFNRWNGAQCYTMMADANGMPDQATLDSIPTPPYLGNIRDMTIAPDESGTMYLWGGSAGSTLYKMDAGMNVIAQYSTGGDFRAIAYDPVTGGFWNGDFSGAVTCYDTTGALVGNSANGSAIASKYGMAWSPSTIYPPANSLWVWSQTAGDENILTQIDVATDAVLGSFTFTLPATLGTAGGASVSIVNNEYVLLLNFQNLAIGCYFIAAVPVELTSFTSTVSGMDVTLNWKTASETNNRGFEVQRTSDGEFTTIDFVEGYGTTTEAKSYLFTDKGLESGNYTYRLKQMDFDGSFEYSKEVNVEVVTVSNYSLMQNYPNPFNPSTKINFSLATDSKVTLTVYNVIGEKVTKLLNKNFTAGNHSVDFNASNLNSGVYFYKLVATGIDGNNFTSVKKMLLTK